MIMTHSWRSIKTVSKDLDVYLENPKYVWIKVSPVVHPCRKIPFALRGKLKEELAHMGKLDVIKKIDEPTEWVSS